MTIISSIALEIWRATEIWTIFCTFTTLTTPKIKIPKKFYETSGDIIILHMCTINENHMMYGS